MKDFIKIAVALMIMAVLSSCEKTRAKLLAAKETRSEIVKIEEDSCFSISLQLKSVLDQASMSKTRGGFIPIWEHFERLGEQVNDRRFDKGGLKVKCYNVTCKHETGLEREISVMVLPNGDLVTSDQELTDWVMAHGTMSDYAKKIY